MARVSNTLSIIRNCGGNDRLCESKMVHIICISRNRGDSWCCSGNDKKPLSSPLGLCNCRETLHARLSTVASGWTANRNTSVLYHSTRCLSCTMYPN